jgi:hypothetical protein
MAIDRGQLKSLIDATLNRMDLYSPAALHLLLGTAAQESHLGTYIRQIGGGPARGIFQMEPATEEDIWRNYLRGRMHLADRVWVVSGCDGPNPYQLEGNLLYQIAIARIHYLRVPKALPEAHDLPGLAAYWKRYWNTYLGAGSAEEFIANYRKYVESDDSDPVAVAAIGKPLNPRRTK